MLADENGVSIKVAKYAGSDKVDLIENEEYGYCSLIKATHQVLEKLKIENITRAKVTNTKRVEKNLIAPIPMREAVINAIVHSDFSREIPPVFEIFNDKMIFTSYGGLLPGQSKEDFFSCSSMPRNRELMRVFKDVGLVEQLGSGMSRILKEYDKSIFHISEHFIKVLFAGFAAFCKFIHQPDGCLCLFKVLYIENCISAASVLRQKNRSTNSYIMQHVTVISQIGNGFDIWHIFLAFLRTFLAHVEFVSSARRHKSCD